MCLFKCTACGSKLLAQTAHAVAKPCKIVCFASVDGACGSTLLAYVAHAVAKCQYAHAVAKTKWPVSHPSVKNVKKIISALKSPTYRDFMIKKLLKSQTSKSHSWAPLRAGGRTLPGQITFPGSCQALGRPPRMISLQRSWCMGRLLVLRGKFVDPGSPPPPIFWNT